MSETQKMRACWSLKGTFGECGGFLDLCDLDGEQNRQDQVCANGALVNQTVTQNCTRDPVGVVTTDNSVSACLNAAGGRLDLGEAMAVIPENALTEPTPLANLGNREIAGYSQYGEYFRLSGGDTTLLQPISLHLPFAGDASKAVLFWQQDQVYARTPGSTGGSKC